MADRAQRPPDPPANLSDGGPIPALDRLFTYEQAGKLLGVTGRTVWTLVDRGDLLAVRFGHSVRIDPADLRAFIERSKQGPASDNAGEGGER